LPKHRTALETTMSTRFMTTNPTAVDEAVIRMA
jgi:hypothetical protein